MTKPLNTNQLERSPSVTGFPAIRNRRLRTGRPVIGRTVEWPVLVCLLGNFRLLKVGRPLAIPSGGKIEALLRILALRVGASVPRDTILCSLWPSRGPAMAGQSLNTLVYTLRRLLGDALSRGGPVTHVGNLYRLNTEAGIGIDVVLFDTLANMGDRYAREGNQPEAVRCYTNAVALYIGDLQGESEVTAVVERERLRARYLTLLMQLADAHYTRGAYAAALDHALRLLSRDPCREDAHRLAMRCYVKLGERAQALRQYRLCEHLLGAEFGAVPEAATEALFNQVRTRPADI